MTARGAVSRQKGRGRRAVILAAGGNPQNRGNHLGHLHINNKMIRRSGCKPEQAGQ